MLARILRLSFPAVSALFALWAVPSVAAQAQPIAKPSLSAADSPSPQKQFVPYWTAEPGWHTELMLRNNLESGSLVVTPTLRLADGTEIGLPDVSIASGTVQSVNVHDALMQSHPEVMSFTNLYGSVALGYSSLSNGNLYASAMVHDDGHPILFHLDGVYAVPEYMRGSREGIWWLPKATTKGDLVLTNLSDAEQDGVLWLYDAAGTPWKQAVILPPRQTVLYSLRDLISRSGLAGDHGGVSLQMQQGAGQVSSALMLYDEAAAFSANMKMFDWDPAATLKSRDYAGSGKWTTRASMLALEHPDPALQLPAQAGLHPQLFLRNQTNHPVKAQLALHWRTGATDGRVPLPEMTLAANQTLLVDVKQLQDNGIVPANAYWAQVTLTTDTQPGEVMAVAASFDDTLRYGAQTPFSDQLAFHLEGGSWQVDNNHDSIIAAGNGTNQPVKARLTFFYAGGTQKYQMEQTIAADDQMWVDVGKLIREGVPDKQGNILPSNLTSGAYQLLDIDPDPHPSLYEGKVVTDKTFGHASYGCMVCCGYRAVQFNPNDIVVGFEGNGNLSVFGNDSCGGGTAVNLNNYAKTWWTDNPAVMTLQPGRAHGVGVGSTLTHADLTNIPIGPTRDGQVCPTEDDTMDGSGNTIPCPTTISVANRIPGSLYNDDPPYKTGVGILTIMQVGPPGVNYTDLILTESVTPTTNSCPSNIAAIAAFPATTSSFTVGASAFWEGKQFGSVANSFYDSHVNKIINFDMLGATSVSSCTSAAIQLYLCNAQLVGTFTLTNTYTRATINGQPATIVTTTKF